MTQKRFATFSAVVLVYNLAVILWGAFVRATGSGAGCGAHWPLCNGVVLPRAPSVETIIEFTHRVTSGFALVLVVILVIWAWRAYPRGSSVRWVSALALFFTLTEALVGAGLVLFEMVAQNTSIARGYWMMAHLINTFLLLAALATTALWARVGAPERLTFRPAVAVPWIIAMLAVTFLGASGAITALGDTLFPVESLADGLRQDFSPDAHLFVRLRIWHPVIAVMVGVYLALLAIWLRARIKSGTVQMATSVLLGLFLAQLVLGVVNVALRAPVAIQLIHLLMADLVWITLVVLGSAVLGAVGLPQGAANHQVHHRVGQAAQ